MARTPLRQLLAETRSGVLLFSLTPPRQSATEERIKEIAEATLTRLGDLDLDGLLLYDIDDESDRNPDERPFPYLPTLDPARYYTDHLTGWQDPVVIYRCVGKYSGDELRDWMTDVDPRVLTVFVGPSSGGKPVRTTLRQAQDLRTSTRPDLPLGAVAISARRDEHLRMLAKQESGTSFFISQVVYHVNETKNLISDYFYECRARDVAPRTVLFTLSLCGSLKTLEFLSWLGVDVPRWLQNSLRHSSDPLTESYRQCAAIARDLIDFCEDLGMPYGFNIENVSIRRTEIEATTNLAREVADLLRHRRSAWQVTP
ncbi:5,10-methylenetetrahydrofolate reductase [Actinoplanes sp. NPDC051861]|uniref:5,10-methylenetetrahydrofolate reductase n=1 Tax=Actinoplanes sp. NPDC051861 TaxID=3155170 RepID=UPI00342B65D2